MTAATHEPDITEDEHGFFLPACTCGWITDPVTDRVIAQYHHDDHVETVVGYLTA